MSNPRSTTRSKGFSLIELLIVLVVVAILTAIAVPSYGNYVMRASRAEAKAVLLEASQFMQRFYAMNNAYDQRLDGVAVVLPPALSQAPREGASRYNITIDGAALGPSGFTLVATAVGPQVNDECGDLSVTNTGARLASGKSTPNEIARCWR